MDQVVSHENRREVNPLEYLTFPVRTPPYLSNQSGRIPSDWVVLSGPHDYCPYMVLEPPQGGHRGDLSYVSTVTPCPNVPDSYTPVDSCTIPLRL